MRKAIVVLVLAVGCGSPPRVDATPVPTKGSPATPKRPVVDTYHGVAVTDDYRWLENGKDEEVRAWSDAQNAATREVLDHLPHVDAIRKRVGELMKARSVSYHGLVARGDTLFALKSDPTKQQPSLVAMKAPGDPATARVVLDPTTLDPSGHTSMDFYVPSLDGKRVAVSLSQRGSESGAVHVYDAATGGEVGDVIERVNGGTAGGSVAWNADGSGFFYTRYPRDGERPAEDCDFFQQVWFHALGTPVAQDRYEIGREFPRIAEIHLSTDDAGKYVLANVSDGDGGEHMLWVRMSDGAWKQVTKFEDKVVAATITSAGWVFMLSRKDAPHGEVLRAEVDDPTNRTAVVRETDATIQRFVLAGQSLYLVDQNGGPENLRVCLDVWHRNHVEVTPETQKVESIDEVVRIGDDGVLVRRESYLRPAVWSVNHISPLDETESPLSVVPTIDFDDAETVREWAVSKDGTRVPMTIIRPKNLKLDGGNPTILYGYGGYGISMTPRFRPVLKAWLEQGGVDVVANIRGGGEFGEEWHRGGNLLNKQNVFDDFAACAKRLEELGYARPEKLALMGGSNGGLLMGAMIAQHPDCCRAVVSSVGIYDMLRVETTPNGEFNVTEFGSVKDEAQFRALYAYSPLHHVADGVAYPSVLFITGANDPRVDPYNSRKMTARLQAATSSGHPILLRTNANAGHGIGSSLDQRIEQETDIHAFLFHELGVDYQPK